jgi:hypothetical protein
MTRSLKRYEVVILILILATYLRLANLGAEQFHGDENFISLRAIHAAYYGQIEWLGPPMSVGLWHSPLANYLYAIPFEIAPDTRLGRAFTAMMNVIAVALTYVIGARYFGRRAGLIAALLYAVHPEAVNASRIINNAQIGAPFVMLYLLTGLSGYYDDKRIPRLAHLPALSLAGQCHPYSFALAPISLLLIASAWRRHPNQWRSILIHTVVSGLIAGLFMLPWMIGTYQYRGPDILQAIEGINFRGNWGPQYTFEVVYNLVGGPEGILRLVNASLTAIGLMWLMIQTVRRQAQGLIGSLLLLALAAIPIAAMRLNLFIIADYLWPALPLAFVFQGAVIGAFLPRNAARDQSAQAWRSFLTNRYWQWGLTGFTVALAALNTGYVLTRDRGAPGQSLDAQYAVLNQASVLAKQGNREVLAITPGYQGISMRWEVLREIHAVTEGKQILVISDGRAMPLPDAGAVLVGPADYDGRPFFSGGAVSDGFRIVDLPPADQFKPDLLPPAPLHLSNRATAFGFLRQIADSMPTAGQMWIVYLIWRIDQASGDEHTVFVHLVDDAGNKYAQLDLPGLSVGQQRDSEYVLSQFNLAVGDGLPPEGPLYLRFGMYNATGQAEVLDESGNSISDYGLIQIRGQSQPAASWPNGLSLDRLTFNSPLVQGPPLDVTATWHLTQLLNTEIQVQWQLFDSVGDVAFSQATDLTHNVSSTALPANTFAIEYYNLRIPTDLRPGPYGLKVQLTDSNNRPLGEPYHTQIDVTARERRFEPPPMMYPVGAAFGDQLSLLGYDLIQNGGELQITLHWQAAGQIRQDYKYFVHVWQNGQVVAQADAMPGGYQYLTSWWAPNEVYSETVSLDLSPFGPGAYPLTTGFYDPASGKRLPVKLSNGRQAIEEWATLQDIELK